MDSKDTVSYWSVWTMYHWPNIPSQWPVNVYTIFFRNIILAPLLNKLKNCKHLILQVTTGRKVHCREIEKIIDLNDAIIIHYSCKYILSWDLWSTIRFLNDRL
jgi:hypothetical protein